MAMTLMLYLPTGIRRTRSESLDAPVRRQAALECATSVHRVSSAVPPLTARRVVDRLRHEPLGDLAAVDSVTAEGGLL